MPANKHFQGIQDGERLNPGKVGVNVAPLRERVPNWLRVPANSAMAMMMLAGASFWYAEIGALLLLFSVGLTSWALRQTETAPLKMPIQAGFPDPHQPDPATGVPTTGQGIFFLGNDIVNGKEIWLTNSDCRQHFLVLGTTGAGKALPKDALVHTPTGWRRIGDLALGDLVSTPDGRTAPVVGVFPQGELDICRLTFADGRTAEACPDHIWEVHHAGWPSGKKLLTTAALAAHLQHAPGIDISIRLPEAVEKPAAKLPFDPYLMGRSLVRGSDSELPLPLGSGGAFSTLCASRMTLPACFKGASVAQRWALLQGVMDSNGDAGETARALSLRCRDEKTARDLQEIIWSLGGIARLEVQHQGYRLDIRHPEPALFFTCPDKVQLVRQPEASRPMRLQVTGIEMGVRQADSVCILVDHPEHLFITQDYVVTHNTESLLGFAANALTWASGLLFCDGKGDVALFGKMYALCRRFGREDDLLCLNFMTGNKDTGSTNDGELMSNTMNPFATGSSDGLTQMVVSLMDDVGGDGAMWKGRATAMLTGIMRALCWLRNQGFLELNVSEIRDYMQLKKIIELASETKHPDLPAPIRKSIRSYLSSLPGFQEDKGDKQAQTTLDQHGYLEMQFTKILGSLADVYGHIFATPYGEVDMYDVVLNRRILVIMLPALEKSKDEIANLGKIVVANLKGMMGATLGSRLEGTWDDVVENRPTNSPSPFMVILDEVGYYTVDGMALMAAQARSLGFSMIYASQDIPAMKKLNEKEAASIIANTNTKIFMRTEEPGETAKLAVDRGDKALRVRTSGFERRTGDLAGRHFVDQENATIESADRITLTDLAAQGDGEMHIISQEKIIRARGIYANPEGAVDKKKLQLRANHFIKVPKPSIADIQVSLRSPEILERLARPEMAEELRRDAEAALAGLDAAADAGDEVAMAARTFRRVAQERKKPLEAACAAVAEAMTAMRTGTSGFADEVRGAYAPAAVPPAGGGFELADFDEGGFGGAGDPARRTPPGRSFQDPGGRFDESIALAGGVPTAASAPPPFAPPARPVARPFGAMRKPQRVDPNVPHGVSVDDGNIIESAKRIASNDAILQALAALDYNGTQVSSRQVEERLEAALGTPDNLANSGLLEETGQQVAAFEQATGAINAARPVLTELDEEEDGDGEGTIVADFLAVLINDSQDGKS